MTDYFTSIGKAMAAEISRNPAAIKRLRHVADGALSRHLAGNMALDAMPTTFVKKVQTNFARPARDQDPEMPPRGREDLDANGNGEPGALSAEECISAIQMMLEQLSGPERDALVGGLHELLTTEAVEGNTNGTNAAALDNRRPAAHDNQQNQQGWPTTAQDSGIQATSFAKRFPFAGHINVMGRYGS